MGKFKEIDLFCKNEDRDGLIAFLADHGIANPHKQANIYLEEYRMNKTVKISDINKEIVEEMVEEKKAEEIKHKIKLTTSNPLVNSTDEAINSLTNICAMLDRRIDMIKKDYKDLIDKVNKICKGVKI